MATTTTRTIGCTARELDDMKAIVAETAPSIPERVTAVQARLQTLLDSVKIMGIQLGAWERAITHSDAAGGSATYIRGAGVIVDDAETALLATIEKLERGTY